MVRFTRLKGEEGLLIAEDKTPKRIAYLPDLYHFPDVADPYESQHLELRVFQRIDNEASEALKILDANQPLDVRYRTALVRFVVSLWHRSPSRLRAIRQYLATQGDGSPFIGLQADEVEVGLKAAANRLLERLVGSSYVEMMSRLVPHRLLLPPGSKRLLTSDRPATMSAQLTSADAFMLLPYGPDRLIVFARLASIAQSFAVQRPNDLVYGINKAVVEQAEDLVIGSDRAALKMIDRVFLRNASGKTFDIMGHIRRRAPIFTVHPTTSQIRKESEFRIPFR